MDKPALNYSPSISALAVLGVLIERRPAEYRVNYRGGAESSARYADALAEAIALRRRDGRRAPGDAQPIIPRGITKRAFVRRHNRKWGARFHREKAKARAAAERRALETLSFREDC